MCTLPDQTNPTTRCNSAEEVLPFSHSLRVVHNNTKGTHENNMEGLQQESTSFWTYKCWEAEIPAAEDTPQQLRLEDEPLQVPSRSPFALCLFNQSLLTHAQEASFSLPRQTITAAQTIPLPESLPALKNTAHIDAPQSTQECQSVVLPHVLPAFRQQQEMGQINKKMAVPKDSHCLIYLRSLTADVCSTSDTYSIHHSPILLIQAEVMDSWGGSLWSTKRDAALVSSLLTKTEEA